MKPLLAAKAESVAGLGYPILATPKIDGIRCLTFEGGAARSRSLKDIPNEHIQAELHALGIAGLDGELWIPGAEDFGTVSSAVMRVAGRPTFEYVVFDAWDAPGGYMARLEEMARRLEGAPAWIRPLIPTKIDSGDELDEYEAATLAAGYEGVMVRTPLGRYKHGRSTVREGILLKLKRFEDDEAEVIGLIEEQHNSNELTEDNLGHAKRSTHKAGKVPKGVLGALRCRRADGVEFKVGTGFTAEQRAELWAEGDAILGRLVKYRHQPAGAKADGRPRIPTFLGFRHPEDL